VTREFEHTTAGIQSPTRSRSARAAGQLPGRPGGPAVAAHGDGGPEANTNPRRIRQAGLLRQHEPGGLLHHRRSDRVPSLVRRRRLDARRHLASDQRHVVRPGRPWLRHLGEDGQVWSDHSDLRPTIMLLTGPKDDYVHERRPATTGPALQADRCGHTRAPRREALHTGDLWQRGVLGAPRVWARRHHQRA
jgi:hypothetical protein